MNDEGESSAAAQRPRDSAVAADAPVDALGDGALDVDGEERQRLHAQLAGERRLDAKRKRIRMLNELLRELDLLVYMQFMAEYYLDCSFFWLAVKAFVHASLLTPMSDPVGERPPDEPKPFLPLILFAFGANLLLHQLSAAPAAGDDTRGYLHGGLMIDFVGQQGPTSKWRLGALDVCILLLQLAMVAVHVKRRHLKKKLAATSASAGPPAAAATSDSAGDPAPAAARDNAARGQDADDEERGVLRRTDTLSDIGLGPDEEDALLASSADAGQPDALDLLTSGQCAIGDFSLVDTILHENTAYAAYRLTRAETGMSDMPDTLRRLNTLRTRFGVGGG